MFLGGQCERILPKTKSIADSNQAHELLGALAVHRPQAETSQDLHCPPRYATTRRLTELWFRFSEPGHFQGKVSLGVLWAHLLVKARG